MTATKRKVSTVRYRGLSRNCGVTQQIPSIFQQKQQEIRCVRPSTFKIIDSIHSSFVSVEKQERHPETTESAKHHNVLGGAAQLQKGITPISGLAKPRRLAPIEKK